MLYFHVHLFQIFLNFPLTSFFHGLFRRVFSVSMYSWAFQFTFCYWFLVIYCCGQRRYLAWPIFSKFLRLVLWPNVWSIIENIPCVLKNVYSVVKDNVLYISVRSIWSIMFKLVFHNSFCLDGSICSWEGEILNSPNYYCINVSMSFNYLGVLMFHA